MTDKGINVQGKEDSGQQQQKISDKSITVVILCRPYDG